MLIIVKGGTRSEGQHVGGSVESHRPTLSKVQAVKDDGVHAIQRRTFAVPNLSGKFLTDAEARELACEKADKAGFSAATYTAVQTVYLDNHQPVKESE